MTARLQDQVAIITGASRGIGRAIAEAYAAEGARLCLIATQTDKRSSRNQSAYNVSKHAVVGLTRCVALEASVHGVTVNAICPGFVQTDMVEALKAQVARSSGLSGQEMVQAALARVPLGRILAPQEVAQLAVYLGSQESCGMTGQSILLDGGMVLV